MDQQTIQAAMPAFMLGVSAGLRSQMPIAALAQVAGRNAPARRRSRLVQRLGSEVGRVGTALAAAVEAVMDKLPIVPDRLDPAPFAGRLLFGSLAGLVTARLTGTSMLPVVALGTLGAGLGTVAGRDARQRLDAETGLPDPLWALVEDTVALTLALLAARAVGESNEGVRR